MRNLHYMAAPACAVLIAAAPAFAQPPKTRVRLHTPYFSPGLTLAESKLPVHGINIEVHVDAKGEGQGKVVLLLDTANYDEFGDFVTGRETDGVNRNRTSNCIPPVQLDCNIKFVKAGFVPRYDQAPIKRSIFQIKGPKITSALFIATKGPGLTTGRLLVHGKDQRVEHVVGLFELKPSKDDRPPIPCHPGCFPAGTKVRVPDGVKPVERVREGDLVTTIDAAGNASCTKVTGVFATKNRVLEVRTEGGKLVTTETQPVALEGGGFRPAGELKLGDRVWRWAGAERRAAAVLGVSPAEREAKVFNLVLDEPKAFIAGDFLVRSKPPAVQPPPGLGAAGAVVPPNHGHR